MLSAVSPPQSGIVDVRTALRVLPHAGPCRAVEDGQPLPRRPGGKPSADQPNQPTLLAI